MNAVTGRQLSCKSCETRCPMERPSSKRSATWTRNRNRIPAASPGRVGQTVVTLDEKDDQKIFQEDPSLQRMRRLILGERRRPVSITCWDTRNSKDHGATCSPIANSWLILRFRTTRTRERLVGKTEMTILTVRLETAGETTIFYKMTLGEVDTTIPAIGFMTSERHAH